MSDYMQGDHDKSVAVVPFSDDDAATEKPDELLEEDKADASPEERIQRKARRNERISNILREGKKNAEENRALREEQEALKLQLAEIRGQLTATRSQPAQNDNARDPYQERLAAVYARQKEAHRSATAEIKADAWTAEREAHYERIAQDIETEKASIIAERVMASRSQANRAEQAQQVWVQKFPEVYANERAYRFAEASFRRKQALLEPGQTPTNEMVEEVMNEAITQFRLGPKKAPTASERSRLSGVPSSGTGGGGAPSGGVQMTPLLRNMATAAYSDLPEAEAVKKWAQNEGRRLREKKIL
jgi:hypothetical protein